ncbi:hypothetical protein ASG43_06410 [Aureimonas sp. Leaf454]|uniref:BA14K family protein n=1 Tax=Aureimonas sp. Leaf454 TaxID=1736381 RepID=UPI0006F525D9|nr:BA14K family protein [Aureimonas sp. Leaf454]KQT50885.1 hypothetical protein ASG43_06410 [Aureimonas sp. Leaf454]
MRMFKFLGAKVMAVAIALSVAPAAIPSNVPVIGVSQAQAQYYGEGRHWRGGGGWRGDRGSYRGGRGYYRGDRGYYRHHRRGNGGAAIAGAVIGLGLGAAIASANQPRYVYRDAPTYYRAAPRAVYSGGRYEPWSRAWYNYCSARYRSFDPGSGTFQPYNGPRQFCR